MMMDVVKEVYGFHNWSNKEQARFTSRNLTNSRDFLSYWTLRSDFVKELHSFVTQYPCEWIFEASHLRRSSIELTRYKANRQIGKLPLDIFLSRQ